MFKVLRDAWNVPDLKKKLLFTLFIIVIYRIGSVIPVPYVNSQVMGLASSLADNSLLTYFSFISGQAFTQATLFALSVSPYITASIVMQLLCVAIPKFQEWQKDGGDEGRKKIDKITRYLTIGLALVTAFGYYKYITTSTIGDIKIVDASKFHILPGVKANEWAVAIVVISCYCAGAAIIMWLGEKINEKGIGNGISIILFINILSSVPGMVETFYSKNRGGAEKMNIWLFILLSVGVVIFMLASITFITHMTEAERRIKISYAKRVQGRKMYGGQDSNLPIKLYMAGVMPIIFAQSIVSIPATIALIASGKAPTGFPDGEYTIANFDEWWYVFTNKWFSYESPIYMIIFFVLIIAFGYFYIAISFDPVEVANNLKKNGGAVQGLRPGDQTANFIKTVTNRITLLGSLFLGIIAIIPLIVNATIGNKLGIIAFGGTSLLIVIGVALETVRELEAQLTTYRRPGEKGIFRGKKN